MKIKYFKLCLILVMLVSPLIPQFVSAFEMLEDGFESSSRLTKLPSTPFGTVLSQSCAACPAKSFRISQESAYFVSETQITFAELQTIFQQRQPFNVLLATRPGTNVVTRILIFGYRAPISKAMERTK